MADWSGFNQAAQTVLESGRARSQSGFASVLSSLVDRLKQENAQKADIAQKQNLLGYEGLMKGTVAPAQAGDTGAVDVPGIGKVVPKNDLPVYKTAADGSIVQVGTMKKGGKLETDTTSKDTANNEKRIKLLGDDLDPNKYRQGAFGVSKNIFDRAERLQSLASAFPDGNLDSRQIEELAIGMNSMLAGSNVSAVTQVQGLVPKSVLGDAQKLKEWISNNPQGMQQQAFVNRMLGTISREKDTAQSQMNRTMFQRLSKYSDIQKNNPTEWDTVLRSAGIDPQEYEDWKKGGYKPITAVQNDNKSMGSQQPSGQSGKTSSGLTYTIS